MSTVYKILPATLWVDAQCNGVFYGSPVDVKDGFIHFSTAEQAAETAAKHFAGETISCCCMSTPTASARG
jgi:uncharacterized protein (DUF952 family)